MFFQPFLLETPGFSTKNTCLGPKFKGQGYLNAKYMYEISSNHLDFRKKNFS